MHVSDLSSYYGSDHHRNEFYKEISTHLSSSEHFILSNKSFIPFLLFSKTMSIAAGTGKNIYSDTSS